MAKSMNKKELRELMAASLKAANQRIKDLGTDQNPQVRAMVIKNQGYACALEDCIQALGGSPIHLKAIAGIA